MSQSAVKKDSAPAGKPIGKNALIDVSKVDEIKQLGFKVDQVDGNFMAVEIDGEGVIGPASSVAALHTLVKQEVGNKAPLPKSDSSSGQETAGTGDSDQVELTEDATGKTWLPGSGPIVDKQIAAAAQTYETIKMERVALSRRETSAREDLIAQVHLKPELFTVDPKDQNSKVYVVSDIEIRIKNEIVEKITTKRIDPAE